MQQLPLAVRPADQAVFESFYPGDNLSLVHALRETALIDRRNLMWLWGGEGAGKSHLLQACVSLAGQSGRRAAYLPLGDSLPPGVLEGMELVDLLCLDDIDRVAGNADWERGLFATYEGLAQRGARLVMSAGKPPLHLPLRLPDLASRLAAAATWRIRALGDEARAAALEQRARWRGLELPPETSAYLLNRVERSLPGLFRLLDELDLAALAAQKRLTIPFVREVLERLGLESGQVGSVASSGRGGSGVSSGRTDADTPPTAPTAVARRTSSRT
ncbi:MAG: DnaA regulatory inactivator Hda [Chromatiales bacterium]|nr:DnaA regulatory inactivator Hda [Chromatiales bacterium]